MPGTAGSLPECEVKIQMIRDHTACAALGRVELELVNLPGKALTGTPPEDSGSLSMQPVGVCTPPEFLLPTA